MIHQLAAGSDLHKSLNAKERNLGSVEVWAQKLGSRDRRRTWTVSAQSRLSHHPRSTDTMPGPSNTLLIEGSFSELADELAQFIDGVLKPEDGSGVQADAKPVLDQIQQIEQAEDPQTVDQTKLEDLKNDALKKIVTKASALNNAPEKGTEHRKLHLVVD